MYYLFYNPNACSSLPAVPMNRRERINFKVSETELISVASKYEREDEP